MEGRPEKKLIIQPHFLRSKKLKIEASKRTVQPPFPLKGPCGSALEICSQRFPASEDPLEAKFNLKCQSNC